MGLQEQLSQDLQSALKNRDMVRVSTLRLLISAVRNKEIERQKKNMDGDVLEVISAQAKSRRESILEFQKGGRADLAAKEESELKVLQAYLPEAMSEAELRSIVEKTIQSAGARGPQDMGRVMSALMPQIKGRADGRQAQQVVQELLKK
jgi:uncharacterized protein YqeY